MATENSFDEIFGVLTKSTNKPEQYLGVQNDVAERLRATTKKLYDLTKCLEGSDAARGTVSDKADALPELIVAGFDEEQIWQELELQNELSLADILGGVSRVTAAKELDFDLQEDKPKKEQKKDVKSKRKVLEEEEKEEEEINEDEDLGEDEDMDDDDDSNDSLRFDKDGDESDMSDEERNLVSLLAKARANLKDDSDDDDDDDDDDDINADFDTGKLGLNKLKGKSDKTEKELELPSRSSNKSNVKKRRTEVDDKFFMLADMEKFLEQEDEKEEKKIAREGGKNLDFDANDSDEEEIDYFADIPSEEEEEDEDATAGLHYDDFFDPPPGGEQTAGLLGKRNVKFDKDVGAKANEMEDGEQDGESDDEEGEDVTDVLGPVKGQPSSYQKRQERLNEKISTLETSALDQKPWQLAGEIAGSTRPENSLLQEDLDFEHTVRQAPVITEETTKNLEDLIKQRVKDKSWDDVERKVKPVDAPQEYKKKVVLDMEKSKLSLGEIYEQEYVKQQQKEKTEQKDPDHEEIKKMMSSLFIKLDALSNFHYTPKPAAPEVKIISNMPSITMEEVAPVSVSHASLMAPEEIQEKQKGELKADSEKTSTDRKRDRREKKKRQAAKFAHIEAKQKALEKKGLGNKYAQEKAMRDLEKQSKTGRGVNIIKDDKTKKPSLTSSTAFFTQLQDEVSTQVQSKKAAKQRSKGPQKSATKYKL